VLACRVERRHGLGDAADIFVGAPDGAIDAALVRVVDGKTLL